MRSAFFRCRDLSPSMSKPRDRVISKFSGLMTIIQWLPGIVCGLLDPRVAGVLRAYHIRGDGPARQSVAGLLLVHFQVKLRGRRGRAVRRTTPHRWRTMLLAAGLALAALVAPVPPIEAHTCTPDPQVGVGGRLLVARDSGAIEIALPGRQIRQIPVMPAQGAAPGVASAPDGGLLAVTRFWRRPEDRIGGQDILVVGADGGAPLATIERGREGDVLGVPSWLPDGSLLYERREL